jgi:PAS domain S-box-containing protein
MNTYSKILITTLPLVFLLLLSTVGTTYYFWRSAFTELAETWLDTRLSEAVQVAATQDAMLHRYGLEAIPVCIAKAKMDAGEAISAIEVGKLGTIFAIDRLGTIAMHPDPAMVGGDVSQELWFKSLKAQRSRLTHLTPAGRNLAMVDYFEPWEWYILASDPEQEVYAVANRMRPYLLGLGIGGFMVMAAALMLLTRWLTQPLRLLTAGAEQIGKGDLDTCIAIRSRDEFGRLARVFNQMAGQLRDTLTALQHREAHFRSLIENTSDLIAILDEAGGVLYVSPSIKRMLGYPRDAVMGRRVFDFVHPEEQEYAIQLFNQRIRPATIEPPLPSEIRLKHQDGSWRTLETVGQNLLDHPAVGGLVVNARDVTQRKAVEAALQQSHQQLEDRVAERTAELFKTNARLRQEIEEREQMSREKEKLQDQLLQAQKMKAIGTLAGGIAHDFNNLLMGIQGNAEIIALDIGPADAKRTRLATILDCVQSGARLTQQLLGFARLGKYQVKSTDINELVQQCTDMFGRTRQELRIGRKYHENVWPVDVDRGQIEQVLINLLINAWQAMPDGGNLYLETANAILDEHQVAPHGVEAGKYVKITVTDTGTGIDPPTLEQIFDPFFTTKTMGRGTGLSLASAYGIVRNHGGFIDVRSKMGQGTTFTIHLKASDAPPAKTTTRPKSAPGASGTILLVDDDPLILEVGKAMLAALGYEVLSAASGKAALDIYRRHGHRIRLVILDMIMPDMGGGKTYDQLKAIDPQVIVLLSSGYSINGQASAIMNRGCNGFIQKPFNLQSLYEKVNGILEESGGP